jgi:hypothetical protein
VLLPPKILGVARGVGEAEQPVHDRILRPHRRAAKSRRAERASMYNRGAADLPVGHAGPN